MTVTYWQCYCVLDLTIFVLVSKIFEQKNLSSYTCQVGTFTSQWDKIRNGEEKKNVDRVSSLLK